MPGPDGMTLAQTILADPWIRPVKLVLLNALQHRGRTTPARQNGVAVCLNKPVRYAPLYRGLTTILWIATESTGETPSHARPSAPPWLLPIHVLVVEDNVINQKVAVRR
jgi:two-component system, sensor histidine kinase and response regulator